MVCVHFCFERFILSVALALHDCIGKEPVHPHGRMCLRCVGTHGAVELVSHRMASE